MSGRAGGGAAPLKLAGLTLAQSPDRRRSAGRGTGWFVAMTTVGVVIAIEHLELVPLLLLLRVVYEVHRARHRHPGLAGALRAVGLSLVWGVAVFATVVQLSGAGVRLAGAFDDLGRRLRNEAPTSVAVSGQVPDDLVLAARYQPLLVFSRGERWRPTTVDRFLADAVLEDGQGKVLEPRPTPAQLSAVRKCPGPGGSACHRLTLRCPSPRSRCAGDAPEDTPAVYVHLIHLPPPERPTPAGPVDTLIQYWFFYRYDDWRGRAGTFQQFHEADWEAATLGFRRGRPQFAAYSEHCGGEWKPWRRLVGGLPKGRRAGVFGWIPRALPLDRLQAGVVRSSHPIAYVARGSHAMYLDARPRVPSWAECKNLKLAGQLLGFSFSAGVREGTDFPQPGAGLSATDVRAQLPPLIDPARSAAIMRYEGVWGGGDRTRILGRPAAFGRGPVTPSLVGLWRDPLSVIFCSPHWRPAGRGRC